MPFKLLFLLFFPLAVQAQDSLHLVGSIPVSASLVTADNLGNLYIVNLQNDIVKYDKNGEQKFSQNFKIYGKPTSIDVSNPMEIYVFYREANTVLYLDNTLSERGKTDLATGPFGLVTAAARSYDNGLWVWDQADLQLKKCTKEQENITSSGNPLVLGKGNAAPYLLADNGSRVFMADSNGISVFDVFANFVKKIPIKKPGMIQVLGQKLYYLDSTKLICLDIETMEQRAIFNFTKTPQQAVVSGQRVYNFSNGKIEMWE